MPRMYIVVPSPCGARLTQGQPLLGPTLSGYSRRGRDEQRQASSPGMEPPMPDAPATPGTSLLDPDAFALNEDALRVESRPIAGRPLLVVDGVYKHPDRARRLALALDFDRQAGLYPGRMAGVASGTGDLLRLVNRLLPGAAGRSLAVHPDYRGQLTFALLRQGGRDLRPLQRQPHFDAFCDVAGVLYLSRPEDCQGGTSFWRHRRSGLEYAPRRADPRLPALLERFAARD